MSSVDASTIRALTLAGQIDMTKYTVIRRCLVTGRIDPTAPNFVLELVPRIPSEQEIARR